MFPNLTTGTWGQEREESGATGKKLRECQILNFRFSSLNT